jgi:Kef-type K+ transport system membrane component KefB
MDILLQILLLIALAKLLGEIVEQAGYSSLIGEIAAGILLGPSIIGFVTPNDILSLFSDIGIIALLFISGAELNPKAFSGSEKTALSTAIAGVAVPFAGGFLLGTAFGMTLAERLFIGTALSITSIAVSVRTLVDLKKLNTRLGATIVGAAVIDDVTGIFLLAMISTIGAQQQFSTGAFLLTVGAGIAFLVLFTGLGRKLLPWFFDLARKTETHEMLYSITIIIALVSAYLSHLAGLHYGIGAFFAGLILGGRIRNDHPLFDSLNDFAFGFFVTFFFAYIGVLFDLSGELIVTSFTLLIIIVALAGKILGGIIGSFYSFTGKEALIIGIGMSPRADIALVVANVALTAGIIGTELFSSVVIVAIVTIILTPVMMKNGFDYLDRQPLVK